MNYIGRGAHTTLPGSKGMIIQSKYFLMESNVCINKSAVAWSLKINPKVAVMSNTINYDADSHNVDSVSVFFESDQAEVCSHWNDNEKMKIIYSETTSYYYR